MNLELRNSGTGDPVDLRDRASLRRPVSSGLEELSRRQGYDEEMNPLLLIIILLVLFGGGGFYFGGPTYGGGGLGLILLICLIVYLLGGFRRR